MRPALLHLALVLPTGSLFTAGCNPDEPRPCSVTCGTEGACPDGTSCTDGYCYAPDEAPGSCVAPGDPDAAVDPDADVDQDFDADVRPDACGPDRFSGANADVIAIPDGSTLGITSSILVDTSCVTVTSVEISVDITHPYRGDVGISLTKLGSRTVTVLVPTADSADDIHEVFDVDIAFGENAEGEWYLTVHDATTPDVGTLDRWSLGINGAAP